LGYGRSSISQLQFPPGVYSEFISGLQVLAIPLMRIGVKLRDMHIGGEVNVVLGLKEKATCSSKYILQCLQIAISPAR
jgi:hypothetical protein